MSKQVTVKVKKRNYQLSSQAQLATLLSQFYRTDYVISSWNTAPDGSGETLASPVTFQNDITAYALWLKITLDYRYPIYNTTSDPTSGIKEWKTGKLNDGEYTLVQSSASRVTWNEGWYVVKGEVTINGGAVCNGAVKLLLVDGCKLEILNVTRNNAGILVTRDSHSLTIYGQYNNTGKLIVTGGDFGAGIGGGADVAGLNITINGGDVEVYGGEFAAGIGGGGVEGSISGGDCNNVIINGGTIYAKLDIYSGSSSGASAIGSGGSTDRVWGAASNIIVSTSLNVVADGTAIHNEGKDIAQSLWRKCIVSIKPKSSI